MTGKLRKTSRHFASLEETGTILGAKVDLMLTTFGLESLSADVKAFAQEALMVLMLTIGMG